MYRRSRALAFVLSALTPLAVSLPAGASPDHAVTPLDGMPWVPSEASCFGNSWNRLTNDNCSGERKWLMDMPIDRSGRSFFSAFFSGRGTGSAPVRCWLITNSSDGSSGVSFLRTRTSSSWGMIQEGIFGFWVPQDGNVHGDCNIPQTGGVSGFEVDPGN